jgi:hypothetical protein
LPAPTEKRIFIVCILLRVMMWKRRLMVVYLNRLTPYHGTARDTQPWGGSNRSSWVIIVRSEPRRGRWDRSQTSQAQPSEENKWRYASRPFGTNGLKERAMWHIDSLLIGDTVNSDRCYAMVR